MGSAWDDKPAWYLPEPGRSGGEDVGSVNSHHAQTGVQGALLMKPRDQRNYSCIHSETWLGPTKCTFSTIGVHTSLRRWPEN